MSSAIVLTGVQLSRTPASETCAQPFGVPSFRTSDPEVWSNFTVADAQAGDVARVEWLDPEGAVARATNFSPIPSPGAYCFDSALSRAGNRLTPALGTWAVRVLWNGAVLGTRMFTVIEELNITTLQLGRSGPTTCTPPPPVTSFQTTDLEIWAYLAVTNALIGDEFSFRWIRPSGDVVFEIPFEALNSAGAYCFVDYLSTAMDQYVPETGMWSLVVVLNGVSETMVSFRVTDTACSYSASPSSVALPAMGGAGTIQVTAAQGCEWSATSDASWLTIESGMSGSGNGSVNYTATQNTEPVQRTGSIDIAGGEVLFTQAARDEVSCTFALAPVSSSVPSSGGTGTFSVDASVPSCDWLATSNAAWISLTAGTSGTGDGVVAYSAASNPLAARTGTITAGGQIFTLNQAGAPVSGGPAPEISDGGIVNAASYMPPALGAGDIARGSIFSIFGSNLGPEQGVRAESYPLGAALAGATISVQQGSTTVEALPIYVSRGQINAIMPSNAPLGEVLLTITYNGAAGTPHSMRVATSNFGAFSVTSSGQGPGIIQNFNSQADQPLNSASASARPRQVAILWGTGLGGIDAADNVAPPGGDLPGTVEIFVGGKPATKLYGGRAPCCAAEDQLVFEVPPEAPEGCSVPVQVRTDGNRYSNVVTMAIERNGQRCEHTTQAGEIAARGGRAGSILLFRVDALAELEPGNFSSFSVDLASAAFQDLGGGGDLAFNPVYSQPALGSCLSYQGASIDVSDVSGLSGIPGVIELDAGNELSVAGAGGTVTIPRLDSESTTGPYAGLLGGDIPGVSSSPPFLEPGSFTIRGTGGSDVGPFQVTASTSTAPIWTNREQITSIDRAGSTTVAWSGGDPATQVALIGGAVGGTNAGAAFVCAAPISDGQFTIPRSAVANLPATESEDDSAVLFLVAVPRTAVAFSASGLDAGYALYFPLNVRTVMVR